MGMILPKTIENAANLSGYRMGKRLGKAHQQQYISMCRAERISLRDLVGLYNIARDELGWSLSDFWAQVEKEAKIAPRKRKGD